MAKKESSVSVNEILSDIRNKKPRPLYLIEGEETFFIDQLVDSFENELMDEAEKGFNFSIVYGKDTNAANLLGILKRYPMMSAFQVVILKEAQQMKELDKLEPYLDAPLESTIFVIAYRGEKVDRRKKFFKAIEKNGVCFNAAPLKEAQIPTWIVGYCKEQKIGIDQAAALLLAEYCGTNLDRLSNEIQKIKINLGDRKSITEEDVKNYSSVNREYNIYELQKAIAKKNIDRTFQIIQYFSNNPKSSDFSLVYCLSTLYNFYSKLWTFQAMKLGAQPKEDAARVLGIMPFIIDEYYQASRIYSHPSVVRALRTLLEYDLRSKGLNNGLTDEAGLLKELAYKLMA